MFIYYDHVYEIVLFNWLIYYDKWIDWVRGKHRKELEIFWATLLSEDGFCVMQNVRE